MLKFILIPMLVAVAAVVIAYFFGLRPNEKEAKKAFWGFYLAGITCMISAFFTGQVFTEAFNAFLFGGLLFVVGFVLVVTSPLFASAQSLASGEPFQGPYQQMEPEEKRVFWSGVRTFAKISAGWYSRYARRNGNHEVADAARFAKRVL